MSDEEPSEQHKGNINIDCVFDDNDELADVSVRTVGIRNEDELLNILLVLVERGTGVSANSYRDLMRECYRFAAREQARQNAEGESCSSE